MKFGTSVSNLLLGLMGASSCVAAPAAEHVRDIDDPMITMPPECAKPHLCYIHTTTTSPPNCPTCVQPTGLACPMIIKLTTTQVPCSNPCCPITPTQTVTTPCAKCPTGCVIPTQTITETTGCGLGLQPADPTAHVTLSPGKA